MEDNVWKNISDEAKDLIKHIFAPEEERFSAKEVLSHPWLKIVDKIKDTKINIDFDFFKNFSEKNNFKKMILYFISTKLNENEIKELSQIFKKFDKNLDGQISYEEFEQGLANYHNKNTSFNNNEIIQIFNSFDINKNGKIDYSEFIGASLENRKEIFERRLLEMFFSYDKQQTGKIKKEDFNKILHIDASLNENEYDKIINDLTKDDLIDYNEFLKLINE